DLQLAAERVTEAAARLGITKADLYPWINAGATAQSVGNGNTSNYWGLGVSLAWEVDLFGRIRRSTERDRAFLMATEEARRGVVLALVSGVALSYVQLRSNDIQLAVAQPTVDARLQMVT